MAQVRKQTHAKQQYRKPVIQKQRKLTEAAEGNSVIISGHID